MALVLRDAETIQRLITRSHDQALETMAAVLKAIGEFFLFTNKLIKLKINFLISPEFTFWLIIFCDNSVEIIVYIMTVSPSRNKF